MTLLTRVVRVRRIGEGQARRLAVMGITVNGREAVDMGIGHYCFADNDAMEAQLELVLKEIRRCEPAALAAVKRQVEPLVSPIGAHTYENAARYRIA